MKTNRVFRVMLYIFLLTSVEPSLSVAEEAIDFNKLHVVDLTHVFDATTIAWPTEKSGFELKPSFKGVTKSGFFYFSNTFCSPEHSGTHLDAPMHFAQGRWTSSDIPVGRFVGPAVVVDISRQAASNADYRLTLEDLAAWEKANGRVPQDAIFLLRTGWSQKWPERKAYLGDDTPGDATKLHFPSFGSEAVSFLIRERGVRMIGVDTASIDYGQSQDFIVHRLVGAANVPALENLTDLEKLPVKGATIIALPMKIGQGSGAPTRVIAFFP
ncbi:MAG: cyclase family protein [Methylocystaceae bacterium]|jgi:kynurenine formamidase|nr:cyclase family protein [Methylocystaceae bacterium]NBT96822.1 cyclase family protein [Methylocystaceae bacterium]